MVESIANQTDQAEKVLNKLFGQVQSAVQDQKTKLSDTQLCETVYVAFESIQNFSSKDNVKVQSKLIKFALDSLGLASQNVAANINQISATQSSQTSKISDMLTNLCSQLLQFIFTKGQADCSKLLPDFFTPAMQMIQSTAKSGSVSSQNNNSSPGFKIALIEVSASLYESCWTRIPQPPTKELYECFTKFNPKSTEKEVRAAGYLALSKIIRQNPSNLFQFQQDLLKHLIKGLKDEKCEEVRNYIGVCFAGFVNHTMSFSNLHTSFDLLFQVCVKGFEDQNPHVHNSYVLACFGLLNMRLQESTQQGDIQASFRTYNVTAREQALQAAINSGKGKKSSQTQNIIDVPRSLPDMISMLGAMFLKILQQFQTEKSSSEQLENQQTLPDQQNLLRKAVAQIIVKLMNENREHLGATDVELLLNTLILTIIPSSASSIESKRQRIVIQWIMEEACDLMQSVQRDKLLDLCLQSLKQKQLLLKVETLQSLNSFFGKNFKVSTLINHDQVALLLHLVSLLLRYRETTLEITQIQNVNDLTDTVGPYFLQPYPYVTKLAAVEVIKSYSARIPPESCQNLISSFLSLVQIANADLMSLKNSAIFVAELVIDKTANYNVVEQIRTLNCYAQALQEILKNAVKILNGVPVSLATTTLTLCKSLIIGNLPFDPKTQEEKATYSFNSLNPCSNLRREAGWILLEGLLYFGSAWINDNQQTLSKLFKSVFRREICQIQPQEISAKPDYKEACLMEFKIKKQAISCLKIYTEQLGISPQKVTKSSQIVAQHLSSTLSFLLNQEAEVFFLKQFGKMQIAQVKSDLFNILTKLSPELIHAKFVTILHPIVETIISEDGMSKGIPCVAQMILDKEDDSILPTTQYQIMTVDQQKSKKNQGQSYHIVEKISDETITQFVETSLCQSDFSTKVNEFERNNFLKRNRSVPIQESTMIYAHQSLLTNAVYLFAHIFNANQLNDKNKNQLLKHFTLHVQPSNPPKSGEQDKKQNDKSTVVESKDQSNIAYYRPEKLQKMIRISLAILQVSKQRANNFTEKLDKNSNTLNEQQHAMILAFLSSVHISRNDFLLRIVSEIEVYLRIPQIIQDPQIRIPEFLAEIHREIGSIKMIDNSQQALEANLVKLKVQTSLVGLLLRNLGNEFLQDSSEKLNHIVQDLANILSKFRKVFSSSKLAFFTHFIQVIIYQDLSLLGLKAIKDATKTCFSIVWQHKSSIMTQNRSNDQKCKYSMLNNIGKMIVEFYRNEQLRDLRVNSVGSRIIKNQLQQVLDLSTMKDDDRQCESLPTSLELLKIRILTGENSHEIKINDTDKKASFGQTLVKLFQIHSLKDSIKQKLCEIISTLLCARSQEMDKVKNELKIVLIGQINSLEISQRMESNELRRDRNKSGQNNLIDLVNFDGIELEIGLQASLELLLKWLMFSELSQIGGKNQSQNQNPLKVMLEFSRKILTYKHTTPWQFLEKKLQNEPIAPAEIQFEQDLSSYAKSLPIKFLTDYIATNTFVKNKDIKKEKESSFHDIREEQSLLFGLAFATCSQEEESLKIVGFELLNSLLVLFKQAVENCGDDSSQDEEDLESGQKQKKDDKLKKVFLQNDLLIQQYEAQIFSIIRQNLNRQGDSSAETKFVSHKVTKLNFQLISLFIKTPVCKDQTILAKILDSLTSDMRGKQSDSSMILPIKDKFQTDLAIQQNSTESQLIEAHLSKLQLLTDLIVLSSNQAMDYEQANNENEIISNLHLKLISTLPSKFGDQEKKNLTEVLTHNYSRSKPILSHLLALLQDFLVLSLKNQGDSTKFIFLLEGYKADTMSKEFDTLNKLVSQTLLAIQILLEKCPKLATNLNEAESEILTLSLIKTMHRDLKLQHDTYIEDPLETFTRQKINQIQLASHLLQHPQIKVLKSSSKELEQVCHVVLKFIGFGIAEMTWNVLSFFNLAISKNFFGVFDVHTKNGMINQILQTAISLISHAIPELQNTQLEQESLFQSSEVIKSERSAQKVLRMQPTIVQDMIQKSFETLKCVVQQILADQNQTNYVQQIFEFIVQGIQKTSDQTIKKFLTIQAIQLWQLAISESKNAEILKQIQLHLLQILSQNQSISQQEVALLAKVIQKTSEDQIINPACVSMTASIIEKLSDTNLTLLSQIISQNPFSHSQISLILFKQNLVAVSQKLLQANLNDQEIISTLQICTKMYTNFESLPQNEIKIRLLQILFKLFFKVIHNQSLQSDTRNGVPVLIYNCFNADKEIFKQFVSIDPQTGQGTWMTQQERELVAKIIQKFVQQQQDQNVQQSNHQAQQEKISASTQNQKQTKTVPTFQRPATAGQSQSKLKLGFGLKKKAT